MAERAARVLACLLILLGFAARGGAAATINVLWYTYAHPASEYRSSMLALAQNVHNLPKSSGLAWNLTFFGPGDPAPNFADYDVLVIHGGEFFRTGPQPGPPYVTPDFSGILANRAAIEAARGERTFVSGSDADFHTLRRDSGNDSPDNADRWDGALGYLVNAINWAGSGNGLGIVSFWHGDSRGANWWEQPASFLRDELVGRIAQAADNAPVIPDAAAGFPITGGLSALGLSNWTNSFHGRFTLPVPGYTSLVDSDASGQFSVTLATSAFADAPLTPAGTTPVLQFGAAAYSVTETDASVTISVTRSGTNAGALSVDYATSDGSAIATADYTQRQGTLDFADGDGAAKTIVIPITQDAAVEAAETFSVTLSNPAGGAALGANRSAVVTIADAGAPATGGGSASGGGGGGGGGCALSADGAADQTFVLLVIFAVLGIGARCAPYARFCSTQRCAEGRCHWRCA